MGLAVQITFDCHDANTMAAFWALALDYELEPPPESFESWESFLEAKGIPVPPAGSVSAIVDPAAHGPRLLFMRVPEAKSAKNRMHLDVRASTGPDGDATKLAKVAELVEAGGREIGRGEEAGSWWVVMHDPEGNEFCVT